MLTTRMIPYHEYRYVHNIAFNPYEIRDYPFYVLWPGETPNSIDLDADIRQRIQGYEDRYHISSQDLMKLSEEDLPEADEWFAFEFTYWKKILAKLAIDNLNKEV